VQTGLGRPDQQLRLSYAVLAGARSLRSERFGRPTIMNRSDRAADAPARSAAEATDTDRKKQRAAGDRGRAKPDSREFEAAVSEGWPVSPEGAGSERRRRSHEPAGGRTSDEHAHDEEQR